MPLSILFEFTAVSGAVAERKYGGEMFVIS